MFQKWVVINHSFENKVKLTDNDIELLATYGTGTYHNPDAHKKKNRNKNTRKKGKLAALKLYGIQSGQLEHKSDLRNPALIKKLIQG